MAVEMIFEQISRKMYTYVWFDRDQKMYEAGSRIDFELLTQRKQKDELPELLYKFNRVSSKLAFKFVKELNETSTINQMR